jgi:RimJ/RimL family protein N-acetyltransferase
MTPRVGPLRANDIQLRPVTESDLPILFEHQREPEANEMAAFPARDRDAFMAHWTKILGDQTVVAMTIVVNRRVAGNVSCWTQDGQRLVGYWIGKEHWGKGVATQMLSMFLRLVADRPLHAHVAKHNVASIRVLQKCGFALCANATGALGEPADGSEEVVYVFDTPAAGDTASNPPPNKR